MAKKLPIGEIILAARAALENLTLANAISSGALISILSRKFKGLTRIQLSLALDIMYHADLWPGIVLRDGESRLHATVQKRYWYGAGLTEVKSSTPGGLTADQWKAKADHFQRRAIELSNELDALRDPEGRELSNG